MGFSPHSTGMLSKETCFKPWRYFFRSGILDPELNKTQITLIPKTPSPEKLEQFWPISLCNFVYKIISKILAYIPNMWLPKIVDEEQSAFVSNRAIQDNIFVVQEVLHQLGIRYQKRNFQAILKLDMQKMLGFSWHARAKLIINAAEIKTHTCIFRGVVRAF